MEATGADQNGVSALTVIKSDIASANKAQIIGSNADGMTLLASNENGTVNVGPGGTVERTTTGTLKVDARTVFVNGLLKSDAGDVTVALNSAPNPLPAILNANTGTTSASKNVNVTGVLNSGNTTALSGDVKVTGSLNAATTTASHDVIVQGTGANLSGAAQVTAGNRVFVEGGGAINGQAVGDLTVTGNRVLVYGNSSKIASASTAGNLEVTATGIDYTDTTTGLGTNGTGLGDTGALTLSTAGQIVGLSLIHI